MVLLLCIYETTVLLYFRSQTNKTGCMINQYVYQKFKNDGNMTLFLPSWSDYDEICSNMFLYFKKSWFFAYWEIVHAFFPKSTFSK